MKTTVLINGRESDGTISVTDSAVLRGDGCFEVLRARAGRVFALDEHLDRLGASAGMLQIPLPPRVDLEQWIRQVAESSDDLVIRVVVTRGSSVPGEPGEPKTIVFGHGVFREAGPTTLLPIPAPWHAAGEPWDLAGAKTLSYAPHMAATRRAVAEGFGDALLLTVDDVMLEGPTFSVAWVIAGVVETPGLALGILDSITRRVALDIASELDLEVREGEWTLDRLELADEVMAWSTLREVQPVVGVGKRLFADGPVTSELAGRFAQRVS
jgi:branched-subunit amino acid aminotransferase/4-amino-4-deoxychorismate lyase